MTQLMRAFPLLLAIGSTASVSLSQDVTTKFTVEWTGEVSPATPTITGGVWVEIQPALGSTIWWTGGGKGLPGILKTFAGSIFDVLNLLNGSTGTLSWTVPQALNVANTPGTPNGQGGIKGTTAGQQAPPWNLTPLIGQKLKILDLEWPRPTSRPVKCNS